MAQLAHRELDVNIVKTFLRSLREGRIYIARITRSGRNGRYAYLLPPLELLKAIGAEPGTRFRIEIHSDYIDYVVDPEGGYTLTIGKGRDPKIRFPIDALKGYVVIEPRPRGFRVYFA